jgi:hypothetical protein
MANPRWFKRARAAEIQQRLEEGNSINFHVRAAGGYPSRVYRLEPTSTTIQAFRELASHERTLGGRAATVRFHETAQTVQTTQAEGGGSTSPTTTP